MRHTATDLSTQQTTCIQLVKTRSPLERGLPAKNDNAVVWPTELLGSQASLQRVLSMLSDSAISGLLALLHHAGAG